ncbi:unnamed protein product [Rodentolepis nana]|uniref:Cadherin domain-containing protein n=1 Tax=Rodentolepis nana TaxID=102285 RepID=A0A0R3TAA0_RODNA|nr:unnamed protein product [Rodentolepis nana]
MQVGKVHAFDRDTDGKNNRVRYHISDESNSGLEGYRTSRLFTITPSGEIYTNSVPIDREQVPMLTFSVVATDSGEPSLSAFATVVIRVEDINDNGPQWLFPPPGPQAASINISAHSTIGMVIARLEAVDPDVGTNGQVEYEIIRGNSQKYFDLDSLSGTLYLAKQFDINPDRNGTNEQNTPTSFALSLKASDNGEPQKSNTSLLRIIVQTDDISPADSPPYDSGRMGGKNQHLTNGHYKQRNSFVDRDLLVMVVMIIIILLVSIIFIIAIVMLRCRQIHSTRENGVEGQSDMRAGGGVGIVRVAQVKPHAWIPPPSQDSSAKSGFTMESSKSSTGVFDGQSHYMTATGRIFQHKPVHLPMCVYDKMIYFPFCKGHIIAADSTLKSTDGNFGRFSPALIVSHHPSLSTTTFQRANQSTDPSPTGQIVYTSKTLPENSSPRYIRQMCSTLPNNATAVTTVSSKNVADTPGRCYMTLNPELYEIDYPYGQLKYHTGVYHHSPKQTHSPGGGCATLVKSTPNIVDLESPPQVTAFNDNVEMPRDEIQKRCRFKIDQSSSRMTPVLGNFDTSESTEETVDGVEVAVDSLQMKRLRNASRNSGGIGDDTFLVDIH